MYDGSGYIVEGKGWPLMDYILPEMEFYDIELYQYCNLFLQGFYIGYKILQFTIYHSLI